MIGDKIILSQRDFSFSSRSFSVLWNDQNISDITLATMDGHFIKVHKVVLSLYSTFFKSLFEKYHQTNPLVYLAGVNFNNLSSILRFIYHGSCEVEENQIESFMATGRYLEIICLLDNDHKCNKEEYRDINQVDDFNIIFKKYNKDPGIAKNLMTKSAENETTKSLETSYENNFEGMPNPINNISIDLMSIDDDIKSIHTTNLDYAELKDQEHKENKDTSPQIINKFHCKLCEANFGTSRGLLYHKNSKHLGFIYGCNQCNSTFTFPSALSTHKLLLHNNEVDYQCDQCELSLRSESSLTRHKKFIHNRKNKIICEKCPRIRIFQNMAALRRHNRFKHEGALKNMEIRQERKDNRLKSKLEDKLFNCDQCEWKSDSKLRLKIHIQSIHEGIYHFCNQCDRSYATSSGLVHHKRLIHDKTPEHKGRN